MFQESIAQYADRCQTIGSQRMCKYFVKTRRESTSNARVAFGGVERDLTVDFIKTMVSNSLSTWKHPLTEC